MRKTSNAGYGYDKGVRINPKPGERLLKEGEPIPDIHREYLLGIGWLQIRKIRNALEPETAQMFGNYLAYAVPDSGAIQEQKQTTPVVDLTDLFE